MTGTGLDSLGEMGQVGPNEQPNTPNNGATSMNQTSCENQAGYHHQDYCTALSLALTERLTIGRTNFPNGQNSSTPSLPSRCSVDPKDQSDNEKPALTNGWVNNSADTETENALPVNVDASTTNEHSILVNGGVSVTDEHSIPANGDASQYFNVYAAEFKQRRQDVMVDAAAVNPELNDTSLNVEGVTEHCRPFHLNANAAPFIPGFSGYQSCGTKDDTVPIIYTSSVEPVDCPIPAVSVDSQIPAVPVDCPIPAVPVDCPIPGVPVDCPIPGVPVDCPISAVDVDSVMASVNWMPAVPPGYMIPGVPPGYRIPGAPGDFVMPANYMIPVAHTDYIIPGAPAIYTSPEAPNDYLIHVTSPGSRVPTSPESGIDLDEFYDHVEPAVELSEPLVSDDSGASTSSSQSLVPPAHMVYMFEILSRDVGYLIGQAGRHVNKIKKASGCSILVQPHPFDKHTRVCVITGTEDQIEEALVRIRKRFPLPEYKHLTLEAFYWPPHHFTIPESKTLSLPEKTFVEVAVCHIINPGHFFLQQPTHSSYHKLETLRKNLADHYGPKDTPCPTPSLDELTLGAVCVAPSYMHKDHGWYRAEIVEVYDNSPVCMIKFLDYGGFCYIETSKLRQINIQFLALPFQAIECYFAHVFPVGGVWSEESRIAFESMTKDVVLQCMKVGTEITPHGIKMPLVNLYKSYPGPFISIFQEMITQGYAYMDMDTIVFRDDVVVVDDDDDDAEE